MSPSKLLSFPELRERGVLLGRRQVDRLEAEGKFPKRVSVGANRVGWVAAEIDDDFEIAVKEGSTMVRVGRAIFGPRPARNPLSQ